MSLRMSSVRGPKKDNEEIVGMFLPIRRCIFWVWRNLDDFKPSVECSTAVAAVYPIYILTVVIIVNNIIGSTVSLNTEVINHIV